MTRTQSMRFDDVVAWLIALEGKRVRVYVLAPSQDAAPVLAAIGVLHPVEGAQLRAGLLESVDVSAQSFRVGDGGELTLWPDRFLGARTSTLNSIEITTLDGVVHVEEERDPWT